MFQVMENDIVPNDTKKTNSYRGLIALTGLLALLLIGTVIFIGYSIFGNMSSDVPAPVMSARTNVVRVVAYVGEDEVYIGSGFAVGPSPVEYIVTNEHVIQGADYIQVLMDDDRTLGATIADSDSRWDLCVLKLEKPKSSLKGLPLGEDSKITVGQSVYALGFPSAADAFSTAYTGNTEDITITDGIISAVKKAPIADNGPNVELIQTNTAINHGNSGGPLLNKKGQVVGVSSFGMEDAQNINAAVSIVHLKDFLSNNDIKYTRFSFDQSLTMSILMIVILLVLISLATVIIVSNRKEKPRLSDAATDAAPAFIEKKPKRQKKKLSKKAKVGICVAVVLICMAGASIPAVNFAQELQEQIEELDRCLLADDYEKAAVILKDNSLISMLDPHVEDYIRAGNLLEDYMLEDAKEVYLSLGDYRDSAYAKIPKIEELLKQEDLYQKIIDKASSNDIEVLTEAYGDIQEILSYKDCSRIKDNIVRKLFDLSTQAFTKRQYEDAIKGFQVIPDYRASKKYMELSQIYLAIENDETGESFRDLVHQMMELGNFSNISQRIVEYPFLAYYLDGGWSCTDPVHPDWFLDVTTYNPDSLRINSNILGDIRGSVWIEDGKIVIDPTVGRSFALEVDYIDANTLAITFANTTRIFVRIT